MAPGLRKAEHHDHTSPATEVRRDGERPRFGQSILDIYRLLSQYRELTIFCGRSCRAQRVRPDWRGVRV